MTGGVFWGLNDIRSSLVKVGGTSPTTAVMPQVDDGGSAARRLEEAVAHATTIWPGGHAKWRRRQCG